jgi:hypothetical protein
MIEEMICILSMYVFNIFLYCTRKINNLKIIVYSMGSYSNKHRAIIFKL